MINKIKDLENIINDAEYHYRVLDKPIISDYQYDMYLKELKKYSELYPDLISPDSPINRIGSVLVNGFKKVKHNYLMGSIDNVYSIEEFASWAEKISKKLQTPIQNLKFLFSDKYDGISASLIFKNGELVEATTRGDGNFGDSIFNNCLQLFNLYEIKQIANSYEEVEIRGELVIFKDDFKKINVDNQFKNERNLVSGTMKSYDSNIVKHRKVRLIPFYIIPKNKNIFDDFMYDNSAVLSFEDIVKKINITESNKEYKKQPYLIDGAVIKIVGDEYREILGESPNWSIAFKFKPEVAVSKVLGITWQVGRNKITPVAELEPVKLEGTTVSRATIHNINKLKRLNIAIGDSVEIEKAGFIIPYINRVTQKSENEYSFPSNCPCCKAPTKVVKVESEELTCTNDFCPAKLVANTIYLVKSLNIAEIGSSVIKELVEKKLIKTHFDILSLKYETIMTLDRMGKTKANKIYNNIQKGLVQPLNKVIQCIAISSLGESNSEKIANKFKSFDDFLNTNVSDLLSIENIGESTANNIMEYISKNKEIMYKLKDTFVIRVDEGFSEKLKGEKIVITGAATKSRDELEAMVKKNGGEISSSVSKKTTTVIIGSKEPADYKSSKKTKAIELNIPVVDEFWLFDKIGVIEETKSNDKELIHVDLSYHFEAFEVDDIF